MTTSTDEVWLWDVGLNYSTFVTFFCFKDLFLIFDALPGVTAAALPPPQEDLDAIR